MCTPHGSHVEVYDGQLPGVSFSLPPGSGFGGHSGHQALAAVTFTLVTLPSYTSAIVLLKYKALKTEGTIQLSLLVLLIKRVWYLNRQVGCSHLHTCLLELITSWES